MLWWRKNSEGFDWHEYVRTTIKLRRDARRDRLDQAQRVAVDQVQLAGRAVASGSRAAGHGIASAAYAAMLALCKGLSTLGALTMSGVARLGQFEGAPSMKLLLRRDVALLLLALGAVALASGAYRTAMAHLDMEALVPLGVGALLCLASLPGLLASRVLVLPSAMTKFDTRLGYGIIVLLIVGVGALLSAHVLGQRVPGVNTGNLGAFAGKFLPGATQEIEGRVSGALSGETFRLANHHIRLTGLDAPDRNQTCNGGARKRWRCGEAAQAALERLVKGKAVTCKAATTPDTLGRLDATCRVEGRDIGAELVQAGHVFSASTYFGGYAALEHEAKRQKLGLWSGEPERPAEYRAKLWDSAKRIAPEGCPIKGTVSSTGKVYLLPWSADYARANVRPARGERWFCSEGEALTAGWRSAERG